jgi:hypothetical protein
LLSTIVLLFFAQPLKIASRKTDNLINQKLSLGDTMSTTAKRVRSLVVTLALVVATNYAISIASNKSGVVNIPDSPRPKSGVVNIPDSPRPKSGVVNIPDSPRPKSGVVNIPDSPRP